MTFEIWVDDGAGQWPATPVSLDASTLSLDNLVYKLTGLASGGIYGVKITATNEIGTSLDSDV